jgi:uncharacterized protein YqgC (DUF456 family)
MDTFTIVMWVLAGLSVIAGIAGLVVPLLPGPLLIFIGLFLAAWIEDFNYVSWGTLITLALLMLLAHLIDFLAGALGAKKFGASRAAIIGATIGAFIGIFFGFIGIILGPFIGAVIGQLTELKDIKSAGQVGVGTWIGFVFGMAAKIAIGLSMIGIFILIRFVF